MGSIDVLKLELPERYLLMVREILDQFAPDAEVWAYGSRVTGKCYDASDLDLVLRNPDNLDEAFPKLGALREEFMESNVPIRVDVLDWARIPESFRKEILEAYVVLREGKG